MNDEELMKQRTKKTDSEHLDLQSPGISDEKRAELSRLFPEIRTEGDKLDFDRLKLALGESVDVGKERYGMTWPGKADCLKTIQRPSLGTLRPAAEESVNFDTSGNLIIEGDNLEVMKLLQKAYLGKVKMIYIDPPYNTGNDFIYPDDYTENLQTYLEYTGQVDSEGKKFSTNMEANGRFHSKWLNMMYPRLYLARNLLRDDGVIFISIDDTELFNLKQLCDQIFGEENFLGNAGRVAKKSNNKGEFWAPNFDYLLTYSKSLSSAAPFSGGANEAAYDQIETHGARKGERYQLVRLYMSSIENRNPEQRFWIECPDGSKIIPPGKTFPPERPILGDGIWRWSRQKFEAEKDRIVVKKVRSSNLLNEKHQPAAWNVYTKTYLSDVLASASAKPNSLIENHINQIGTGELRELEIPFDYPKPSTLVRYLMECARVEKDDLVLDFFAGSGPTAQAVLDLNKADGGERRFILVQLPERCEPESEPARAGFGTIADITKERVRRVIKKLNQGDEGRLDLGTGRVQDRGFRVFKLDESNFRAWNADVQHDPEALEKQLELHVDHVRKGRTPGDLLIEILLKSGFPLTTRVEELTLGGKTVHSVADGALLVCLDDKLTLELIRAMADRKPERVVCLDQGFAGADQLKANAVQIFKTKGVTSFKTI